MVFSLPDRPAVDPSSAFGMVLSKLKAAIESGDVALIPPFVGLRPLVVVRWLYRAWLQAVELERGWQPLVHLDLRFLGDGRVVSDVIKQATGGWLFVEGKGIFPEGPFAGTVLLRTVDVDPVIVPDSVVAAIGWQDRFHLTAVDPTIADLRRSLYTHCRSCSTVHLSGPPGSGKQSLALWAHAMLDSRHLSHLKRGGQARPVPGEWEFYQELSELEPSQLRHLKDRLKANEPQMPVMGESTATVSRPRSPAFAHIIGEHPAICSVLATAERVAQSHLSVLILGETGTGKELMALAIHKASGRRGELVTVDVSAKEENLATSDLFGHKKGAFTGADQDRLGAVRQANGGTLFLDEVGNLTLQNQMRLLRMLESRMVSPLGDDRVYPVDIRVVAATHVDLEAKIERGEFREDLFQRLNAVTLRLPPLRERPTDIPLIAEHFYKGVRGRETVPTSWLEEEARAALMSWRWTGNVRELRNVIEKASVEAFERRVRLGDLGALAKTHQRPVPLLTSSSDGESGKWNLEKDMVQRLTAATLVVKPLSQRGAKAVRAAIFGLLEGRPIFNDTLAVLERRNWEGNFPQLHADIGAIRGDLAGPVDLTAIRRALPHLLGGAKRSTIVFLRNPVLVENVVVGQQQEFAQGAVVVGRVRALRDVEAARDDAAMRARLDTLKRVVGTSQIGFYYLPEVRNLSRIHFIATCDEAGLSIHALPDVAMPVFVSSMSEVGTYTQVAVGRPVSVGLAAEVMVVDPGGQAVLQVFVYAGAEARDAYAFKAIERNSVGGDQTRGTTLEVKTEDVRPKAVWPLNGAEQTAMVETILGFPGGNFKDFLERWLGSRRADPAYQKIAAYILDGPRPTMYFGRLYENRVNRAVPLRVAADLRQQPDWATLLSRLPAEVKGSTERAMVQLEIE